MAPRPRPSAPPSPAKPIPKQPAAVVEVIDPRWLLRAGAVVVAIAVLCGYLTVCGLFYYGQSQLVLHPVAKVSQTPTADALPFTQDSHGAWYIPSESTADPTVLLLHGADGNVGDTVPLIQLLHAARLNVYAAEYRGFGSRAGTRPSQQTLMADAEEAFAQVTSGGVKPKAMLLVGQGVGASLAVGLAQKHADVAAVMLDQPDGDVAARLARDPRTHLIPVRLLLHDKFALEAPLATLATPKLIVTHRETPAPLDARLAADPKMTVELAAGDTASYLRSLRRFLDQYVARPVPSLFPAPASQ